MFHCRSLLSWVVALGLVAGLVADGGSAAWGQVVAPAKSVKPAQPVKPAPPGAGGFGNGGGVGANGVRPGAVGGGVGLLGGAGGGGGLGIVGGAGGGAIGFGGGFPGMPAGGFAFVGGMPVLPAAGGGAPAAAVRPLPAPRPVPVAVPKTPMVDRELVFDVAADATVTKLQASTTGLNYVAAKFEDIQVGHRLSLSAAKKGEAARPDDVTGTVLAINAAQKQVTVKVSVPADQPAAEGNSNAQTVTIRSQK